MRLALLGVSPGTAVFVGGTPVIVNEAVPSLVAFVPVTVFTPTVGAVQFAPVQVPSGAIVNVVVGVTLPRELLYWSKPSAV